MTPHDAQRSSRFAPRNTNPCGLQSGSPELARVRAHGRHQRAGALRVGESFRFRLVYDSTVAFTTYTVYPTITVAATPASVTVSLGSVAGTKGVGTVT